ncbi:MAG: alpha-galactosidase [Clostridia bacterium]|nr:alpha-galactosidase [Clostridia bacterium]
MKKNDLLALGAAATATAVTLAGVKKKNADFCPFCEAKRLLNKLTLTQGVTQRYDNGAALTPPMGWSSWNLFASRINEDLIKEIAAAIEQSGLAAAGYRYVNIDDCWQSSERDADGRLQSDKATFPHGIRALADSVNAMGLKLGLYSSNGTKTCEDYPASLRHEAMDADTIASWGVEYFKYDFCHNVPISEKAPRVRQIELSAPGEAAAAIFTPDDVTLKGKARILTDDKDGARWITGLCSRGGSFSINVEAPEDGDRVLTLIVAKASDAERFLRVTVNGKDEYHLYAAQGRAPFRGERRIQLTVRLQAGMNTVAFDNPVGSRMDSAALQYKLMGRELKRAAKDLAARTGQPKKPIVFSICEWGFNRPWKWGAEAGNLWRTTGDIKPVWPSILAIYEATVRLNKYAGVGGWNDPDMLECGNGKLTLEENRSHFSLWCMMAAPLILGNDVRKFVKPDGTPNLDDPLLQLLTNETLIAIDQDALGVPCRRVHAGLRDILVKPLTGGRAAVCVFNKTKAPATLTLDFKKLSDDGFPALPQKAAYQIRDAWSGDTFSADQTNVSVAGHGVRVFVVE